MNKNLFVDEALRQVISEHFNSMYLELSDENLLKITELYGVNRGIKNLHGIELLKNLKKISLWDNQITDISPLFRLDKLRVLDIEDNPLTGEVSAENFKSAEGLKITK